jgi:hypothetical protein
LGKPVAWPIVVGENEDRGGQLEPGRDSAEEAYMSETNATPALEPFPEPDPVEEEALEEWVWVLQERAKGRFDEYAGQHVAVVNKTVLGSSLDPNLLRQYLAEKHNIDPRRIVIFSVYDW